jgi:transposase
MTKAQVEVITSVQRRRHWSRAEKERIVAAAMEPGAVADMRKGFDGLAPLVQEALKRDPHSGHLFVFRGRRGGLIKVLWHDGQGMCLFAKRLERGRFIWPSPADGAVTISSAQLGYLLEGIDWRMPQQTWRPQAAG